jgi:hypothetical protein
MEDSNETTTTMNGDVPNVDKPIGDVIKNVQETTINTLDKTKTDVTKAQDNGLDNNMKIFPPNKWINRIAANYLPMLIAKYGQPSSIDPSPGGQIVWKPDRLLNTSFDHIVLKDEALKHGDHADFVYHYINYHVPADKLQEILALSKTMGYDQLKKQLWSVGKSDEYNIATLALATYIGQGYVSLAYIKTNGIYQQWLTDTKNPNKVDHMYDLLSFNLRRQIHPK